MKTFLTIVSLLLVVSSYGQESFTADGYYKSDGYSRGLLEHLGEFDGRYYVAETRSKNTLKYSERILVIRVIDKMNLRVVKKIELNDVGLYNDIKMLEDKVEVYDYHDLWMNGGQIKILVSEKKTKNLVLLSLDAKTLKRNHEPTILLHTSEKFIEVESQSGGKSMRKLKYAVVQAVHSSNRKYINVLLFVNGDELFVMGGGPAPTNLVRILLDMDGKILYQQDEIITCKKTLERDNTSQFVLDNGNLVLVAPEKVDKKNFEQRVYTIDKEGEILSKKAITKVSTSSSSTSSISYSMHMKVQENRLYMAGYDTEKRGIVAGSLDLSSTRPEHKVTFTPFDKEALASIVAATEKEREKKIEKVIKGKIDHGDEFLASKNLFIAPNGDMVLIGAEHYHKTVSSSDYSNTQYYFNDAVVTRLNQEGQVLFTKVIKHRIKTQKGGNYALFNHKAYFVNDHIVIFMNDYFKSIWGAGLENGKTTPSKKRGVVISIKPDGTQWTKTSYNFNPSIDDCMVLPFHGLELKSGSFLFPIKQFSKVGLGYLKMEFN